MAHFAVPGLFLLLGMRRRTEKGEYRTWWERSEEKDRERNRKDEYLECPSSWETFGGKRTEKTAKREVCTRNLFSIGIVKRLQVEESFYPISLTSKSLYTGNLCKSYVVDLSGLGR